MNRAKVPQDLVIMHRPGMSADEMPQFSAESNKAITWAGWCMEADAGVVRVNHCNDGWAQKWNRVIDNRGHEKIQLLGTNKCLDVADNAHVELRECSDTAT
jgi:hypothetical protein